VGNVKSENDRRMIDSNYGTCVDLFAPGVNIPVASNAGIASTGYRSGTSFAAPHVTGVIALFLERNPRAQPAAVWAALLKAANNKESTPPTPQWCGIPNRLPGSHNMLLHWGSGSDDGVTDAPQPVAAPPPSPTC
jgi:subtilisin family serine protease